uniref:Uncharacterized protein n=1 Tax=Aegilops tauschii subsp. strangulata TaxID=200361 RepID=A0A453DP82_AEGTS
MQLFRTDAVSQGVRRRHCQGTRTRWRLQPRLRRHHRLWRQWRLRRTARPCSRLFCAFLIYEVLSLRYVLVYACTVDDSAN